VIVAKDIPQAIELSKLNPGQSVYYGGGAVRYVDKLDVPQ